MKSGRFCADQRPRIASGLRCLVCQRDACRPQLRNEILLRDGNKDAAQGSKELATQRAASCPTVWHQQFSGKVNGPRFFTPRKWNVPSRFLPMRNLYWKFATQFIVVHLYCVAFLPKTDFPSDLCHANWTFASVDDFERHKLLAGMCKAHLNNDAMSNRYLCFLSCRTICQI